MTKLITIMAAGLLALGTAFAGQQGDDISKVQNEDQGLKMACTIPMLELNLTAEQKEKWAEAMAAHHKTGCTPESEAKLMTQAKEILTPEQFAKFKEKYENGPATKM